MRNRVGFVLLAFAASCTINPEPTIRTIDKRELATLSAVQSPSAFLLFDPHDCFTCGAQMGRWLDLRRQSPGRIRIVLTRKPSAGESRGLAARRIPIDGVVRRKALHKEKPGGHVFVFRAGVLVASGPLDDTKVLTTLQQEFPR